MNHVQATEPARYILNDRRAIMRALADAAAYRETLADALDQAPCPRCERRHALAYREELGIYEAYPGHQIIHEPDDLTEERAITDAAAYRHDQLRGMDACPKCNWPDLCEMHCLDLALLCLYQQLAINRVNRPADAGQADTASEARSRS